MHNLSPSIQTLLFAVDHCLAKNNSKAYLHGDLLLHELTGNEELSLSNKLTLAISCGSDFKVHNFYKCLLPHIVINREIESSDTKYHIMTSGYELILDLIPNFDPTVLAEALQFGHFNLDMLFRDIRTQELKHPPEVSVEIDFLKNIVQPEDWVFEDIVGFIHNKGVFPDINIDPDQYERLRNLSLATVLESLDVSWEEEIERILLSRHPGSAMQFLSSTFVDGTPWAFKILVDYLIAMDVSINEESTVETVFNQKKFDMVNLYSDYFLTEKKSFETAEEVQHRLTTTLKLFFDSPSMSIPKPYVNRISTMAGGTLGRCCLTSGSVYFGCGQNIDEIDCHLPPLCPEGSTQCLQMHPAFTHIPAQNWASLVITDREWCPNQVCPEDNAVHCLEP